MTEHLPELIKESLDSETWVSNHISKMLCQYTSSESIEQEKREGIS